MLDVKTFKPASTCCLMSMIPGIEEQDLPNTNLFLAYTFSNLEEVQIHKHNYAYNLVTYITNKCV